MTDRSTEESPKEELPLARKVGIKAERKLRAQRNVNQTVWLGLGMMGLIGW
ncbi:MAG TPA: F0F1 ATP synthase subunit, partial [Methanosarcina sp.]|nr:F0F1 ATP synthase subunit [Methanosarcina sp.]